MPIAETKKKFDPEPYRECLRFSRANVKSDTFFVELKLKSWQFFKEKKNDELWCTQIKKAWKKCIVPDTGKLEKLWYLQFKEKHLTI